MAKPNSISELRDQLLDVFDDVRKDPRRCLQAKEMTNAAGKAIASLALQLEYCHRRGETPEIAFMGKCGVPSVGRGASK